MAKLTTVRLVESEVKVTDLTKTKSTLLVATHQTSLSIAKHTTTLRIEDC